MKDLTEEEDGVIIKDEHHIITILSLTKHLDC